MLLVVQNILKKNVRQHTKNVMALHAQMFQTMSQTKIKLTFQEVLSTLLRFVSILLLNLQLIEVDMHSYI